MKYNKLVRDKIPQIIKEDDKTPVTHLADDQEYIEKLKQKLKEEVNEFLEEDNEEELADILEVVYSICKLKKTDKDRLETLRKNKAKKRGSFDKRIILDEVK